VSKTGGPLTRQRVLEAALQLIERDGLEGFSMRKLGAILGVEAMSLYNHVESKRALFDGVVELLLTQVPYPEETDVTPCEELWAFAHAFREILRAHPRTLPLRTPATLATLEHLLATIHRANVTGVQAVYALQGILGFTIGQTLLDVGATSVAGLEPGPNGPAVWRQFPAERYPTLHTVLPEIRQWKSDHEFDFALQALFQGMFE
jgi:AcrR family transcriptional regulator